jgi:hypothetical protein
MARGYLAVVDAEEWWLESLRAYEHGCEDVVVDEEYMPVERAFEKEDGERLGAYVRMLGGESEYGEWMTLLLCAGGLLTWSSQAGSSSRTGSMLSLMPTSSSLSYMMDVRSSSRARLMLWSLLCNDSPQRDLQGLSLLNSNIDRLVLRV